MKNASVNSPLVIKNIERCNPQPGQSIPKNCLFMHGIIYLSKSNVVKFYNCNFTKK